MRIRSVVLGAIIALTCATQALAHIRIAPTESQQGAREKYTMRVPNEKQVKCIRIEGEFPADVSIYDFEFKKDDKGKIVGAVWTGVMMPYEFVEFGMLGLNSKTGTSLVWKFVQYYDDGSKEEFNGPPGSRLPSPVTTLSAPKSGATQ